LKPAVSIITPYLNAEAFILKLIENIKLQTFSNWELLLIDDDSSDGGHLKVELAASLDKRIKPLRSPKERNKLSRIGPWFARNFGLKNAQANLIAFLDVDDLWHPQKLEFQVAMHQNKEIAVTYSNYFTFDHSSRIINAERIFPSCVSSQDFLSHNPIPLSCSMLDKSLVGRGFTATFLEDYCFWIDVSKRIEGQGIRNLNNFLTYYGEHLDNRNKNKFHSLIYSYQAYRAAGFGMFHSSLCCARWIVHHSLRLFKESFIRKSCQRFSTIDDHMLHHFEAN